MLMGAEHVYKTQRAALNVWVRTHPRILGAVCDGGRGQPRGKLSCCQADAESSFVRVRFSYSFEPITVLRCVQTSSRVCDSSNFSQQQRVISSEGGATLASNRGELP
jgi:hypothetical protein